MTKTVSARASSAIVNLDYAEFYLFPSGNMFVRLSNGVSLPLGEPIEPRCDNFLNACRNAFERFS